MKWPSAPWDKYLSWLFRFLVGGAFILAGALKIAAPEKFAMDVSNYHLVPYPLINLVAILLPWVEVVAGAFVLTGIWVRASAFVITCLTIMFSVVILSALARGLNIECGCFGTVGGKHIGLVNLTIDLSLLVPAALLAMRADGFSGTPSKTAAQQPIPNSISSSSSPE